MWNLMLLAVIISLVSVYTTANFETFATTDDGVAMNIADSMALYREAVSNYFTQNNIVNISVSFATLKAANLIPSWSTLYQQTSAPIWSNYRDSGGTIYVYATSLPAVNIAVQITRLSKNSLLAGIYQTGVPTMYSPIFGNTNIPLTALQSKSVPNGAPVWIATTK